LIDEKDTDDVFISATGTFSKTSWPGMIPNKGEALIVTLPEWKYDLILKDEIYIVPWGEDNTYWIGSYYEPWPETPYPTVVGKQKILKKLQSVYQGPFIIQNHVAGVRPTMKDRRPLVGAHPSRSGCFLFNGMGTKGTSLAPHWAKQLLDHIISGAALPEEVLPSRFQDQHSG
jgi:glycine/D-amino acid oxidase-like deaminating enzyme